MELITATGYAVLVGVAAFWVGRLTSPDRRRARQLGLVVEDLQKEHESALGEIEAGKHEFMRYQRELAHMRDRVSEHFVATLEWLGSTTLECRALYEQFTADALASSPGETEPVEATALKPGQLLDRFEASETPDPEE